MNKVNEHWELVLEPLSNELFQNAEIYLVSSLWTKLGQAYFSELNESLEHTKTMLNYLHSSGNESVKVPEDLAAAIQLSASREKPDRKVMPMCTQQVLRQSEEELHLYHL